MGRPLALQVLVRARRVRGDLLRDDVDPRPLGSGVCPTCAG